jgi:phosphoglycolate phosphatase-like HAD superfamily hydrolase
MRACICDRVIAGEVICPSLSPAGDLVDEVRHSGCVGRAKGEPHLMKPNPFALSHALKVLRTQSQDAVFIGDSVSDVQAGRAAGIPIIGYANKPAKPRLLAAALADVIITSMDDLISHDD